MSPPPRPTSKALRIAIPPSINEVHTLELRYRGSVREEIFDVNVIAPDRVELAIYAAYFPRPLTITPFTFRLSVNLPEDFVVVTRGRSSERTVERGRVRETWESDVRGTDVPLFASPNVRRLEKRIGTTAISVYYRNLPDPDAAHALREAHDTLAFLAAQFGPTRVDALRIVFSPREGRGYSRNGWFIVSERRHMALSAGQLADQEARPSDAGAHGNAHEISHFWWNLADTTAADDWLNEALAEYSAMIDSRRRGGPLVFRGWAKTHYRSVVEAAPTQGILETGPDDPHRYVNWYERGALMFVCAEERHGTPAVHQALRELPAIGRTRPVVTQDAITVLQAAGATALELDAWLRSPQTDVVAQCIETL